MIEIVPAILVKNKEELNERVSEIESHVKRLQMDVMDGKFVPNVTIQPEDLTSFKTNLMKEAHLMVEDNKKYVEDFLNLGFDMIIVHCESCKDIPSIIKKVKDRGKKIALAINPPTPLSMIKDYLDDLDMVLLMTVNPGFSGQGFISEVLSKIKKLREMRKDLDIEVDGGIKLGTAKLVSEAGANILVSCSGIFKQEDKKRAIESMKKEAMEAKTITT